MTLWCVTGVVHVGRDPVAAAVRYRLPVVLLLHLADTLQDAAGHLTNAGEGGSGGGVSVFWGALWGQGPLGASCGCTAPRKTSGFSSPAHGSVSDRTGCPCVVMPGGTPLVG